VYQPAGLGESGCLTPRRSDAARSPLREGPREGVRS